MNISNHPTKRLQNNIPAVYIAEIHCIVKSTNLSTIFPFYYLLYNKKITHTPQREPAFSVGQLRILHVKAMFGRYRRGVAACMYF